MRTDPSVAMKAPAEAARLSMDRAMGDEAVVFRNDGSSDFHALLTKWAARRPHSWRFGAKASSIEEGVSRSVQRLAKSAETVASDVARAVVACLHHNVALTSFFRDSKSLRLSSSFLDRLINPIVACLTVSTKFQRGREGLETNSPATSAS